MVISVRRSWRASRKCSMSRARRRSSCSMTKSTSQPSDDAHEADDAGRDVGVGVDARPSARFVGQRTKLGPERSHSASVVSH